MRTDLEGATLTYTPKAEEGTQKRQQKRFRMKQNENLIQN